MTMTTWNLYTSKIDSNTVDYPHPLRSLDPIYILFNNIIFKVFISIRGSIPIPIISLHSILQERGYIHRLIASSSLLDYNNPQGQVSDIIQGNLLKDKNMLRAKFKQVGPSFQGRGSFNGNKIASRPLSVQLPRSSSFKSGTSNDPKRPLSFSLSDNFNLGGARQRNSSLLILEKETKASFLTLMNEISFHFILPPQFESPVKKLILILKKTLKRKKSHRKLNKIRYSKIERPNSFNSSVKNIRYESIGEGLHMNAEDRKVLDLLVDQYKLNNIPIPFDKYEKLVHEYKEKILPVYFQTSIFLENSETKTDFAKYCKLNRSKIVEKYPLTEERFSLFFTVAMRQWSVLPYSERRINSWMYSKPERSFASRDELKMFNAEWIGTSNVDDTILDDTSTINNNNNTELDDFELEPDFINMDFKLSEDETEASDTMSKRKGSTSLSFKESSFNGIGSKRCFSTGPPLPDNDTNDYQNNEFSFDNTGGGSSNDSQNFDSNDPQTLVPLYTCIEDDKETGNPKRFISTSTNLEGDTRCASSDEDDRESDSGESIFNSQPFSKGVKHLGSGSPITSISASSEIEEDSGVDTDDIENDSDSVTDAEDTTVVHNENDEFPEFNFGNIFKSKLFPTEVEKSLKSQKTKGTSKEIESPEALSFEQRVNKFEMISGGVPGFFKRAVREFRSAGKYTAFGSLGRSKKPSPKPEEIEEIIEKVKKSKDDFSHSLSLLGKTKIKLYQETLVEMQYEAEYRERIIHPEEVWMRRNKGNLETWESSVESSEKKLYFYAFMKHYINIIENFDDKDYSQDQLQSIAKICTEYGYADLSIVKEVATRYPTYV